MGGHVDAGKTSLLDKLRRTNVQGKEARGITQQIGATLIPRCAVLEQTRRVNAHSKLALPGLLLIDTPGHETFVNLRSRGVSLCDIAIVVVNIKKGLEPQTVESLRMLREHGCQFVVALNQVDRLYGWEKGEFEDIRQALAGQSQHTMDEFDGLLKARMHEFNEQGLNCGLYWDINGDDRRETVSMVPTSAITGQGMPNLVHLLASLSQDLLAHKLEVVDELECTVIETRANDADDLGVTMDVLLKNGVLRTGDRIVLAGATGPIVTTIKGLLTPEPLRDMRTKQKYTNHSSVNTSMGIKIFAPGLEKAIAGTTLRVVRDNADVEELKASAQADLQSIVVGFEKEDIGVFVKAGELGKLEALLAIFRQRGIPVLEASVGEVQQKDVKRAAIMREKKCGEFSAVFVFDAPVSASARDQAKRDGVQIVASKSIYELDSQLDRFKSDLNDKNKKEAAADAVFPVTLRVLQEFRKSPMILGVQVENGQLRVGTPLCVSGADGIVVVGQVAAMQKEGKPVSMVRKPDQVGVEITQTTEQAKIKYGKGKAFESGDYMCSYVTRLSIQALQHFHDEMSAEDLRLLEDMKKLSDIV